MGVVERIMNQSNKPHLPDRKSAFDGARKKRESLLKQRGCVVWFTGLSGAGKSTLAQALQEFLLGCGHLAFVLDGDEVRTGLNADLGFSRADRDENIRRVAEVARLFADGGIICITAFISPFRQARERARRIIGRHRFFEIHVAADLATCEQRDVKGLYRKARTGAVEHFTGITQEYEPPLRPALKLNTAACSVPAGVHAVVALLRKKGILARRASQ
jgi:adenylylsulfate kinase